VRLNLPMKVPPIFVPVVSMISGASNKYQLAIRSDFCLAQMLWLRLQQML
jgi:hypothetical protein